MNSIAIKELRKRMGVTQEKLAEQLGVSLRTVQNYEDGGVIPKSKHAILHQMESKYNSVDDSNVEPNADVSTRMQNGIFIPREVFEQLSRLTETILSQQRTIESLTSKFRENN